MRARWLVMSLLLVGCSGRDALDYSGVELTDVTGRVTLDGDPLAGAVITFEDDQKRTSIGQTDDHGHYRLRFDHARFGCRPGHKTVRITTAKSLNEGDDPDGVTDAGPSVNKERLPARYNMQSELTAEVSATNAKHNFPLTSN